MASGVSTAAAHRLNHHLFSVVIIIVWGQKGFICWGLSFIELERYDPQITSQICTERFWHISPLMTTNTIQMRSRRVFHSTQTRESSAKKLLIIEISYQECQIRISVQKEKCQIDTICL